MLFCPPQPLSMPLQAPGPSHGPVPHLGRSQPLQRALSACPPAPTEARRKAGSSAAATTAAEAAATASTTAGPTAAWGH